MIPRDEQTTYLQFSRPGGHLVAKVMVPSVGQNEAPAIREQVVARLEGVAHGKVFVLDLSQVSLLASMGLGVCLDLRNCAEKAGLKPVLFGMNRNLMELFQLMKIAGLFTILKSPQELERLIRE